MVQDFIMLFSRDLERLKNEIEAVDDTSLWVTKGYIKNSAGNLALHLVGNLNNYIAKVFGKSGYIRDRDAEFSSKNIPKEELLSQITLTKKEVISALKNITDDELSDIYPEEV